MQHITHYSKRLVFTVCLLISINVLSINLWAQSQLPPNILLVLTDDQGWWDVGVHDNEAIETPNIDDFSKEGINFSHYYAGPVCSPTRAGMMTGRYHLRTGLYNTRFGGDAIDKNEITIAELLQDAGYRTGLIGKWHLGKYHGYQPNQQGFDEFFGHYHGHIEEYDYPDQLVHNGQPVEARKYVTDLFTDAAINFIGSTHDQPFFCYLAYNAPHSPFVVGTSHGRQKRGDKLISKYMERGMDIENARIYAMVEIIDQNFGRLMDYLDDTGLAENTIVVFAGDNGGVSDFFKAGIRGRKGTVYEGGVRVPFFVRWPGSISANITSSAMISHIDFLPTVCDIVNIEMPNDRKIDGKSILPLLKGETKNSPHKYLYHHWDRYFPNPYNIWAVTDGRYKLLRNLFPWKEEPDKLPEPFGELYDLKNDPDESNDISAQHPEKVEELRREFLRWFESVTEGMEYSPIDIPVGHKEENPVEIQASWAKLRGPNINYTFLGYDWDSIDKWKNERDTAVWSLDVGSKGTYEVSVSYACAPSNVGGQLVLNLGENKTLQFEPSATPSGDVFVKQKVDTVDLNVGKSKLMATVSGNGNNEVIKLNRIWLRKIEQK